ncbi:AraC family transcriptional regulator [Gymnodinialimonas hymeniacidonis]|uniref:AraC family transcriptional regulator n=1 Tax=Gymnodinialimonas hymeniacidonis TaxID=3126508 RepID=UPI0034C660B3
MSQEQIRQIIEARVDQDGLTETRVPGVKLFRATEPLPCAPAVYEPCIVAIVSGSKEAVLDGQRYVYDSAQYLCCPTSLPVKAGTPAASSDNPLFGVFVTLDQRIMGELAMDMENAGASFGPDPSGQSARGIKLAQWDEAFADTLLRLVQASEAEVEAAVLGPLRLREFYYAVLRGEAGQFARHAFGAGNAIARSIAHVAAHLEAPISIDEMADRAGMSRAVFHRKFKQVTTMSPIQFVKSMRLGNAAMRIAGGVAVSEAALDVGYASASQFSREFKRMYGQSPRQWSDAQGAA